jgi:hypothetical protein
VTVVRTVGPDEQLIVDPRAAAQAKARGWEVSPLALVSLAVASVLALCALGLAGFVGLGFLIK